MDSIAQIKAIICNEVNPKDWTLIEKAIDAAYQAGQTDAYKTINTMLEDTR